MGSINLDTLYYYSSATDPYDHSPPNHTKDVSFENLESSNSPGLANKGYQS